MALRKSVSIALSPELQAVAERLRDSGRYGTIGDVMRTVLRRPEEREPAFQAHGDDRLAAGRARAAEGRRSVRP